MFVSLHDIVYCIIRIFLFFLIVMDIVHYYQYAKFHFMKEERFYFVKDVISHFIFEFFYITLPKFMLTLLQF